MVPRCDTTSSRLMPMPLSDTVMVRADLSYPTRIFRSGSSPNRVPSFRASKRSLSQASDALETSSRRKISLLEYKEWIIRCSSCLTSAWKARVSCGAPMWVPPDNIRVVADGEKTLRAGSGDAGRAFQAPADSPNAGITPESPRNRPWSEPNGKSRFPRKADARTWPPKRRRPCASIRDRCRRRQTRLQGRACAGRPPHLPGCRGPCRAHVSA